MTNAEVEAVAIELVLELERQAGREPIDASRSGKPYDVESPPRKIEVKAFVGSARGQPLPLEQRQVDAARADPETYYLYVVDHVARPGQTRVRVIPGPQLLDMIARTKPQVTYWPTFQVADYDAAEPQVDLRPQG